jgi:hypothetical protein
MTIDRIRRWRGPLLAAAAILLLPGAASAQSRSARPAPSRVQPPRPAPRAAPALRDGAHDFDFEFGRWKAHIARRLKPLTGSNSWVDYDGISVVRPVWGGRANLGELDVSGSTGRIEGLSLRLYDPQTRQWKIRWANGRDGALGEPMVGGFANGQGLFYDQEDLNGRAILVRFVFSGFTPTSFRIEQAFSDDGGKSWEVNWISEFTKAPK